MKITSCACFEKIAKTLEEQNKKIEIENTIITEDMSLERKTPYIYLKSGKKNIKKKEYIYALANYCSFCGKEIKLWTEEN